MSRGRRLLLGVIGVGATAAGGTYVWARPTINSCPSAHDPITPEQCRLIRTVPDGRPVEPSQNPGARVFENFLTNTEPLLKELQPIKRDYGINLIEPVHAAIYRWQMSYLPRPPPVNMLRVTGRPEHQQQRRPWGYGENLDESALPPVIKATADRIRAIPGLRLGKLRDVTINWRHSSFLRLDPHLDPTLDGENIFIISVDGAAVLTLTPNNWWKLSRWINMILFEDEREQVRREAERSWTSYDVDALVPKGAMLHISADARWKWTHGTRLGVEAKGDEPGAGSGGLMYWFGRPEDRFGPVPERHSVVFAFAAPDEKFPALEEK